MILLTTSDACFDNTKGHINVTPNMIIRDYFFL